MRYLRRNKFTLIALGCLMLIVVVVAVLKNEFVPDEKVAAYGTRLDGIENHKIGNELFDSIKSKLKENERVLEVTNYLHGKIINLIITVNDEVSVDEAKGIANSTIGLFENEELSYYSLQVYVKKNNEKLNNFPIIGYKGTDAASLNFTKDRAITEGE